MRINYLKKYFNFYEGKWDYVCEKCIKVYLIKYYFICYLKICKGFIFSLLVLEEEEEDDLEEEDLVDFVGIEDCRINSVVYLVDEFFFVYK